MAATMKARLDQLKLLEESSGRVAATAVRGVEAAVRIPRAQRGLNAQLAELAAVAAASSDDAAARANSLLSNVRATISLEAMGRSDQSLTATGPVSGAITSASLPSSTDVASFTLRLHRAVHAAAISEASATSMAHLHDHVRVQAESEWELAKASLLESLGLGLPTAPAITAAMTSAGGAGAASAPGIAGAVADAAHAGLRGLSLGGSLASASGGPEKAAQRFGLGEGDLLPPAELDVLAANLASVTAGVAACSQEDAASRAFPVLKQYEAVFQQAMGHEELYLDNTLHKGAPGVSDPSTGAVIAPPVDVSGWDINSCERHWALLIGVTGEDAAAAEAAAAGGLGTATSAIKHMQYADEYGAEALAAAAGGAGALPVVNAKTVGLPVAADASSGVVAAGTGSGALSLSSSLAARGGGGGARAALAASLSTVPFTSAMHPALAASWSARSMRYLQQLSWYVAHSTIAEAREAAAQSAASAGHAGGGQGELPFTYDPTLPVKTATILAFTQMTAHRLYPSPDALRGTLHLRGVPLYPLVFLLLRMGARREALAAVDEALATVRHEREAAMGHASPQARALADRCLDWQLELHDLFLALGAYVSVLNAADADAGIAEAGAGDGTVVAAVRAVMDNAAAVAAIQATGDRYSAVAVAEAEAGGSASASAVGPASADPWRAAVLCLLGGRAGDAAGVSAAASGALAGGGIGGGGDAYRRDPLFSQVGLQGYLWHRLWFAVTSPLAVAVAATPAAGGRGASAAAPLAALAPYTLLHIGASLLADGALVHDDTGSNAYNYAEALLCAGQPEAAVAHLAHAGAKAAPRRYLHDAVHMAVGLHHYGLLRPLPHDRELEQARSALVKRLTEAGGAAGAASTFGASLGRGGGGGMSPHAAADEAARRIRLEPVPNTGNLLHVLVVRDLDAGTCSRLLCIDLRHLVTLYAERVLRLSPLPCADYVATLRPRATRVELLARLIHATGAFARLCGPLDLAVGADGVRAIHVGAAASYIALHNEPRPGVLPATPADETAEIIIRAAQLRQEAGDAIGALQLFLRVPTLRGGLLPAADIITTALAPLLDEPLDRTAAVMRPSSSSARELLADVACAVLQEAQHTTAAGGPDASASTGDRELWAQLQRAQRTLALLVDLCDFYDVDSQGAPERAYGILGETRLLPTTVGTASAHWASVFPSLAPPLQQCFGALLRAAAKVCIECAQVQQQRTGVTGCDPALYEQTRALAAGWPGPMEDKLLRVSPTLLADILAMADELGRKVRAGRA